MQRGWWFSAHEQWKWMVLPYLSVTFASRVFKNCEKARTLHSVETGLAGMYASVNDVSKNENIPDYNGAVGIQSIAFEIVERTDVITPYSTFPSLLTNLGVGLSWYCNMLQGPRMQGYYGSTEAVNLNGTLISPLTTWDSKVTTLVAMLGGVGNVISQGLSKNEGKLLERFQYVVNREYSLAFPQLNGETLPFGIPQISIPTSTLGSFSTCSPSSVSF